MARGFSTNFFSKFDQILLTVSSLTKSILKTIGWTVTKILCYCVFLVAILEKNTFLGLITKILYRNYLLDYIYTVYLKKLKNN